MQSLSQIPKSIKNVVIVDMDGYTIQKQFYPMEMGFYSGRKNYIKVIRFVLPFAYVELSEKDRGTIRWVNRNILAYTKTPDARSSAKKITPDIYWEHVFKGLRLYSGARRNNRVQGRPRGGRLIFAIHWTDDGRKKIVKGRGYLGKSGHASGDDSSKNIYTEYIYKRKNFPIHAKLLTAADKILNNLNLNTINATIKKAIHIVNDQFNFNFFKIDNDDISGDDDGGGGKKKNRLTFAFAKGEHGHAGVFDGPSVPRVPNILAHSALPPDKHICYDLENTWSVELLLSVTLHELGHCLGLLDVKDRRVASIMGTGRYELHGIQTIR
ncbi:unnamed protein product [Euphydryas editha]|uniref:Peptidase M10 metallopeptidase domain-containing protein n=1 Tax=Euphydryas editha TaxID=104508 RepID=A0AAU9URQ8_EUPED|nr:unnamed protein product [Euphydryas editha]